MHIQKDQQPEMWQVDWGYERNMHAVVAAEGEQ